MKKKIILAAIIAFFCALGGFFYLRNKDFNIVITEAQILDKLHKKAPFKKEYLMIFEVSVDKPRIKMIDGSDRVFVGADITLNLKINKNTKNLGGTVDVLTGVSYDNKKHAFFLTKPEIEKLSIQGIPNKYVSKVNSVINKALRKYLSETDIYTLKSDGNSQSLAKRFLKKVVIKDKSVIVTLGI